MDTVEQWLEQGLTPNDLYPLYEEFKNKWWDIQNSKIKPLSKVLEELQFQLLINSCWNISKKSEGYVDERGSFFFGVFNTVELKIRIKEIVYKEEENDSPYIQIKYDFFQIYKNSNEDGKAIDLRYEEGWFFISNEKDLEPIGFEAISNEEYNDFGNRIKSIIELV